MNKRDRNREEQLTRLFASSGPESIPMLEPDPGLPTRIRALAREAEEAGRSRPAFRLPVGWVSVAAAVIVLAAGIGGYAGYQAGTAPDELTIEQTSDENVFVAALLQRGFVEDLSRPDTIEDEEIR